MRVLVAGNTGLVGSAIVEYFQKKDYDVIGINSKLLNLLDRDTTFKYFRDNKPEVVIDAAARVGGIKANMNFPTSFLSTNLQIQLNLMDAALKYKTEKFVFLGSSCIYPRNCPQPMREEYLFNGPLETTNSAYAMAKLAGIEGIKAARKEFEKNWISILPTNVYGPRDNFNESNSHVLPALIRKFADANLKKENKVTLWGSGKAKREFIHSEDLASAIELLLNNYDNSLPINIGTGEEISISDLAKIIAHETGFEGSINWDTSMPDGMPRKLLDSSIIMAMGWKPTYDLSSGIRNTVDWYFQNSVLNRVRT